MGCQKILDSLFNLVGWVHTTHSEGPSGHVRATRFLYAYHKASKSVLSQKRDTKRAGLRLTDAS